MTDQKNTILAIVLSAIVLIGWQYFFAAPQLEKQKQEVQQQQQAQRQAQTPQQAPAPGVTPGQAIGTPGTAPIPGTAPVPGTTPAPGATTGPAAPGSATAGSRSSTSTSPRRPMISRPRQSGRPHSPIAARSIGWYRAVIRRVSSPTRRPSSSASIVP